MTQLHQVLALEKSVKTRAESAVTATYHAMQKAQPWTGLARSYTPKDDAGDQLPGESTKVQLNAENLLTDTIKAWNSLLDITATKDYTNCVAKADVVVNGTTLVTQAPVSFLIFLDKKLDDVRAVLAKIPTLAPDENWHYDETQAAWATDPKFTVRNKKVQTPVVLYPATIEHPAQVQVLTEDVMEGIWQTVNYSGAMPQSRLNDLKQRVNLLQDAVKAAREQANSTSTVEITVGATITDWLFS